MAVLKAVADPSRYRLLWALSRRELPVGELARMLGAQVAATSQHLAKLRAAGLVTSRREGTRVYYRAAGVRGLLEEAAQLAGDAGTGSAGPGGGPRREPAAVAEQAEPPARTVRR